MEEKSGTGKKSCKTESTVHFRPACPADAVALARCLREADRQELAASHRGQNPAACLEHFIRISVCCICGIYREEIIALAGIYAPSFLGAGACVWLLTGRSIVRVPISFVRYAKHQLAIWLNLYPQLENSVDARYHAARKLIACLGGIFTARRSVYDGKLFLHFIFRR